MRGLLDMEFLRWHGSARLALRTYGRESHDHECGCIILISSASSRVSNTLACIAAVESERAVSSACEFEGQGPDFAIVCLLTSVSWQIRGERDMQSLPSERSQESASAGEFVCCDARGCGVSYCQLYKSMRLMIFLKERVCTYAYVYSMHAIDGRSVSRGELYKSPLMALVLFILAGIPRY